MLSLTHEEIEYIRNAVNYFSSNVNLNDEEEDLVNGVHDKINKISEAFGMYKNITEGYLQINSDGSISEVDSLEASDNAD